MKGLSSLRGVGLLLVAATGWGGLFPVAMVTLPVLDPFHMTAIRYGITATIFVGLLVFAEGPQALKTEGHLLRAALLGTAGFAGLGLAFSSVCSTPGRSMARSSWPHSR